MSKILTASAIHPAANLSPSVKIPYPTGVVIGMDATIGAATVIMSGVVIGSVRSHQVPPSHRRHASIGRGVYIGSGAKILGGVIIGDGARVGANAVVLEDVEAGSTVVGIPAVAVDT